MSNPKAGTISKTSSEFRREQTNEAKVVTPPANLSVELNLPEVPESPESPPNEVNDEATNGEQLLLPPPQPKTSSFVQRGSFFQGM